MKPCGIKHPQIDVTCIRVSKNHPAHSGKMDIDTTIDWINPDFRRRSSGLADDRSKRKLKEMASRVERDKPQVTVRAFAPSEETIRGRVALYLLKYLGEWVTQEELEHPTIARSAAVLTARELKNHYGWPIDEEEENGSVRFRLNFDPRPTK